MMYELAKQYKDIEMKWIDVIEEFLKEIDEVIDKGENDVVHYEVYNRLSYDFKYYDVRVNVVDDVGIRVLFVYTDRYDSIADHNFEITIRKEWMTDMSYYEVYKDMVERSKPLFEQDKEADKLRLERLAEASGYLLIPKAKVEWYNKDKGALV